MSSINPAKTSNLNEFPVLSYDIDGTRRIEVPNSGASDPVALDPGVYMFASDVDLVMSVGSDSEPDEADGNLRIFAGVPFHIVIHGATLRALATGDLAGGLYITPVR